MRNIQKEQTLGTYSVHYVLRTQKRDQMETCSGGGNELADKQLFSRIPELEPVGGSVWFRLGSA